MRNPAIHIALLTMLFGGAYYALRSIPASNCNFLHYEQTVVTGDGMQYCGSGASYFIDVDQLPFPVKVVLTPDQTPVVGQTTHYRLSLVTDNGHSEDDRKFQPSELAVTMTKQLHLLLVDSSLSDYQHIHPVPVGDSGDWTFDFAPHTAGTYKVFAQFMPSLSMREMVGVSEINVPGSTPTKVRRGLAAYQDDGYIYHLSLSANPVPAGTDATLTFSVERADKGPVQLQEIMGTLAHMVAFDDALHGLAHMHPTLSGKEHDPLRPEVSFLVNLSKPGLYRVWSQVKIAGVERYAPFDINVLKD